jgi:hypothetical protein
MKMEVNTKIETNSDVAKAISALSDQRKVWEAGTYAASNAELYALLGQTLTVLYRVKRSTELSRGLNGLLKERGFVFTDATTTETKLLRAVFCDPAKPNQYKQRIYVYARVLSVAFEAKITGDQLPAFIVQHGGIDEIRRHDPKNASKADKEKLAVHVAEQTLTVADRRAIATGIQLNAELQPADGQHFSLALVRKEVDGTGSIVFGTNNTPLVRSVLGIAGRKIDADEEKQRQRIAKAEMDNKRRADVDATPLLALLAAEGDAAWNGALQAVTNVPFERPAHDRWGVGKIMFIHCDDFMKAC